MNVQSELHRKALDQVATLLSDYESGRIAAESFRVGVETIWNILGGVVSTPEFAELMADANAEVRTLPVGPRWQVFANPDRLLVVTQKGLKTTWVSAKIEKGKRITCDMEDQAIETAKSVAVEAKNKGLVEFEPQ